MNNPLTDHKVSNFERKLQILRRHIEICRRKSCNLQPNIWNLLAVYGVIGWTLTHKGIDVCQVS